MTELKIKQADINNNGNHRLMGDFMGGGVKLKICIVFGCGHVCSSVERGYAYYVGSESNEIYCNKKSPGQQERCLI